MLNKNWHVAFLSQFFTGLIKQLCNQLICWLRAHIFVEYIRYTYIASEEKIWDLKNYQVYTFHENHAKSLDILDVLRIRFYYINEHTKLNKYINFSCIGLSIKPRTANNDSASQHLVEIHVTLMYKFIQINVSTTLNSTRYMERIAGSTCRASSCMTFELIRNTYLSGQRSVL